MGEGRETGNRGACRQVFFAKVIKFLIKFRKSYSTFYSKCCREYSMQINLQFSLTKMQVTFIMCIMYAQNLGYQLSRFSEVFFTFVG